MGQRHLRGWPKDFDSLASSETSDTELIHVEPSLVTLARRQNRGLTFVKQYMIFPSKTYPNPLFCLLILNSGSFVASPHWGYVGITKGRKRLYSKIFTYATLLEETGSIIF